MSGNNKRAAKAAPRHPQNTGNPQNNLHPEPGARQGDGGEGPGRHRRAAVLCLTLSLIAATATLAHAALDPTNPDTELTPKAKEPTQWTILGGAKFDRGGDLFNGKDSPTPHTVDFFSTAFSPDDPATEEIDNPVGFFAGAECIDRDKPFDKLAECDVKGDVDLQDGDKQGRRPAIYRYSTDELGEKHIERMDLVDPDGPDRDKRGFVGSVAWIDANRALAVGGDRVYPRREPPAQPGGDAGYAEYDKTSWAGKARVWIYEDKDEDGVTDGAGEWRELRQRDDLPGGAIDREHGDELPDGMAALTALDCFAKDVIGGDGTSVVAKKGTCFAGGMQQLWRWHPPGDNRPGDDPSEGFDSAPAAQSQVLELNAGGRPVPTSIPDYFHFRVRQIRVNPDNRASMRVAAVTSGCCAEPSVEVNQEQPQNSVGVLKGARLLTYSGSSWKTETFSLLGAEDVSSRGAPLADSYYGFLISGESDLGAIASPGGEPSAGSVEPGSRIVLRLQATGKGVNVEDPTDRALDRVRLLAVGGDYQRRQGYLDSLVQINANHPGDVFFDWAVGRFKDSEQGVTYTTIPSTLPLPNPFTCKLGPGSGFPQDSSHCGFENNVPDLKPENVTDHELDSKRLLAMGTYALNALSYVPQPPGAQAWAAGDRGAVARLGGEGTLGGADEPDAPALQAQRPTPLTERGPFDPFRAGSGQARAGAVPALAAQPLEKLPAKTLVPWGTADASRLLDARRPEQVSALAMSRDGSEGWAVGSPLSGKALTLQHFDGERWASCDPKGLPGLYEPDPACKSLRPLLDDLGVRQLTAIERIPLERDGDPSNDDEFAAIAIGAQGKMLRYQHGSWELDVDASKVLGTGGVPVRRVAFRAPDDGWIVTNSGASTSSTNAVYHYTGGNWPDKGRWVQCGTDPCEGAMALLNLTGAKGNPLDLRLAGDTLFVAGGRQVSAGEGAAASTSAGSYPFVLSKRPGEPWRQDYDPGCPRADDSQGKCDPPEDLGTRGQMSSFSVVDLGDGEQPRIAGWLLGKFGAAGGTGTTGSGLVEPDEFTRPAYGPDHVLLRRDPASAPGSGRWAPRKVRDVAEDLIPIAGREEQPPRLLSVRGADGGEQSFILPSEAWGSSLFPPLEYDQERDRWGVLRAPFVSSSLRVGPHVEMATKGKILAAAPDEQGGLWIAARSSGWISAEAIELFPRDATFFYRYTDERRREVFKDAPNPIAEPITGMAGARDGSVWVSTESDRVYHYDRIAGWERTQIKGWDRGRVVTQPSKVFAVAVNDTGVGIAVGEDGRIADLSPGEVALDPASGRRCSDVPPPCGTPRDLRAAAVAPDGSAIAGGDNVTLLWRPAGGQFRRIEPPRVDSSARVTGLAMPEPGRAWATLNYGKNTEIWAGRLTGDSWRWERESDTEAARDEGEGTARLGRLYAIKVQSDGRGLAVGFRGAMLERSADGTWRRLKTGFLDNLHSIAFPPSGYGDGTIVGGKMGIILTRINGRYSVARQADWTDPLSTGGGQIVGLALSGGSADGDVEAWAASQVAGTHLPYYRRDDPAPFALLHYGSDENALLSPQSRAKPLPDAPAPEPGEVTLAALGRSECQLQGQGACPPFQGTNLFNEVITRRIQAELRERRRPAGGAFAALFTGDINVAPGRDEQRRPTVVLGPRTHTSVEANVAHDQWREFFAGPLLESGVPTFAALGKTDLSRARVCRTESDACEDSQQLADAGLSSQWRQTFAEMPKPWGGADPLNIDGVKYRPVEDDAVSKAAAIESPNTAGVPAVPATPSATDADGNPKAPSANELPATPTLPPGGAATHYALDMVRDGEPAARLIFIDNSFAHSLSASDPDQNPVEGSGGQAAWLERVLCIKGQTCASGGSREPGQAAVVISNAPTYSYGPGALEATQTDGSALEAILLRHRVSAVVSGRLGWNGLFYTLAPGVHTPCPGGAYPQGPPRLGDPPCALGGASAPAPPGGKELADAARKAGAPLPSQAEDALGATEGLTNAIPNVIASTAGGRFGPRGDGSGEASDGYWHGYSVIRVPQGGDPAKVIVEQRPILDWVGITASKHVLRPGQSVALEGFGREPLGTDTSPMIDKIDSPAITHCYDLLLADPEKPWVPLEAEDATKEQLAAAGPGCASRSFAVVASGAGTQETSSGEGSGLCDPYVCVPASVGSIDDQTGEVQAGSGGQERTFALAVLSVGQKTATWPLVFEPRPSFRPEPVPASAPPIPGSAPPPAPAPPAANPPFNLPTAAPPPALPPLAAQPPLAPPAPPAPPNSGPAQLDLFTSPPVLSVAPGVSLFPPSAPVINVAPPTPARPVEKAKKVAVQSSGSDSGQDEASRASDHSQASGGDLAQSPPSVQGSAMTRHENNFTAIAHRDQPSAWARDLQWGGGLTLASLVFFMGWLTVRPTPRRRQPEVPAPARSYTRGR